MLFVCGCLRKPDSGTDPMEPTLKKLGVPDMSAGTEFKFSGRAVSTYNC